MTGPGLGRPPSFAVVSGAQVGDVLAGDPRAVVDVVEQGYRLHGEGGTVNPPSCFLRFPGRPTARIIALPASVAGDDAVDGIKWISSFPSNVPAGLPRASAVLVLNDPITGYPFACLEASIISATRTAASAVLAADRLTRGRLRPDRIGFVGAGLIARYIHTYLVATGWQFDAIAVNDVRPEHAEGWREYVRGTGYGGPVRIYDDLQQLVRSCDLIVFATVAAAPHVHDPAWFDHHPVVLHVSLRDLSADVILASTNVVDDVEHCLVADTSPHLAEQAVGNRTFVHGTLYDVLIGRLVPPGDRSLVFSPFGLGVLDLVVGRYVYDQVAGAGGLTEIEGFFHELCRYGDRVK